MFSSDVSPWTWRHVPSGQIRPQCFFVRAGVSIHKIGCFQLQEPPPREKHMEVLGVQSNKDVCYVYVQGRGVEWYRKIWLCSEILVLERKLRKCTYFIYSHPLGNEILKS